MQSLSWKIALTGAALVSAGAWSCQKNGSSPDAASSQPPSQTQAWETQSPGGQQASGMQQSGAQQPGMQQPGAQQPGGQAAGSAQASQGIEEGEQLSERSPVAGQQPPMESCPMYVEGTEVEVSNTQEGVALKFTTQQGEVSDLRQRVNNLAQMYLTKAGRSQLQWFPARGQRGGQGGMGHGRGAGMEPGARPGTGHGMGQGTGRGMGMGGGMGMGQLPPTTAMVSELPEGAQIELQPTTPQALGQLREQVRLHAERLNSGQCWMSLPPSDQSSQPQGSQSPNEPGR